MSTNDIVAALTATRTAPALPAVPVIQPQSGAQQSATDSAAHSAAHSAAQSASRPASEPGSGLVPAQPAPAPVVPGTTAALPVAEAALRRALASGSNQDPHTFALDLLRSVEALIRASAPIGMSPDDIGAAAARLVERQGLLARLSDAQPSGTWPTGAGPDDLSPRSLDTRL